MTTKLIVSVLFQSFGGNSVMFGVGPVGIAAQTSKTLNIHQEDQVIGEVLQRHKVRSFILE